MWSFLLLFAASHPCNPYTTHVFEASGSSLCKGSPLRRWRVVKLWKVLKRLFFGFLHPSGDKAPHSSCLHQVECSVIVCLKNSAFFCKMFSGQKGISEWACHFHVGYTIGLNFFLGPIKFMSNNGFEFILGVLTSKEVSPRMVTLFHVTRICSH